MATVMDSTQPGDGQEAKPVISQAAVQLNSFDPDKFKQDLLAEFRSMISDPRTVQSVKDKTLAEIRKDRGLKDYLAEIQSMRATGMSDQDIAMEARLRDIEARVTSVPDMQSTPGRVVAPLETNTVAQAVIASGIDMNDPEISSILSSSESDVDKMTKLFSVVAKKKNTQPNPALVAQPAGGSMTPVNAAQLEAQYKKEVMANRGNRGAIEKLKQEYAEKGLNVNAVVFSI